MQQVTRDDIADIVRQQKIRLDWDNFDFETNLTEQGADSLDMIGILFAIQEKYNIKISDESIANGLWLSVAKMVDQINATLQKK
jgi:acyl carrier protein